MYNIAIFASGTGSNALKIISYFKNSKIAKVVLIVSNNKNAGVKSHAINNEIEYQYYDNSTWKINSQHIVSDLIQRDIDLIVLADFLLLIPQTLLKAFPDRILNIHPALLPEFGGKGMYGQFVHQAVKASATKESGITIHLINNKYDEGRIVFQARTPVGENDTAEDIQKNVLKLEHKWYPQVIESFLKEKMQK